MEFEWDENKNQLNFSKHRVDFTDALHVFIDINRVERRVKYENIEKQKGRTVKKDLDDIQDTDIIEHAISDLDSPVPTEAELNEFERVGCKDMLRKKL